VSRFEKPGIGKEHAREVGFVPARVSVTAEAVEKAHPLEHFILDYCLHQSIQKHA
jgi:hypothetical protein